MTPTELRAKVERQKQERQSLEALWQALFPDCSEPSSRQFLIWLNRYSFDTVVAGIEKTLQREQMRSESELHSPRGAPMDCGDIIKYASGCMQGIKIGRYEGEKNAEDDNGE